MHKAIIAAIVIFVIIVIIIGLVLIFSSGESFSVRNPIIESNKFGVWSHNHPIKSQKALKWISDFELRRHPETWSY